MELWQLKHCGALFDCVCEPARYSALRCHSSIYFSSNQVCIFITNKRKKREGNQLDAPPPRIPGFWIVTNVATCNFIEISCNFLSLKITNSLLEQLLKTPLIEAPFCVRPRGVSPAVPEGVAAPKAGSIALSAARRRMLCRRSEDSFQLFRLFRVRELAGKSSSASELHR